MTIWKPMSLHQSQDMPDGSAFGGARNDWVCMCEFTSQRRYIAEKSRAAPGPSSHGLASAPCEMPSPPCKHMQGPVLIFMFPKPDRGTRYIGSNPLSGWEQVQMRTPTRFMS
uniref:Uncharacterized protein n=1 Tax=Oryza sativa subsp. japonica TaxID=39947 RepID=Q8GVQ6_ORYSJ|nr:hypothetical protein [Oryza sativa Japonica Group]BAD30804.1 hypothetical protein [Oryza sativa Japonica Group]